MIIDRRVTGALIKSIDLNKTVLLIFRTCKHHVLERKEVREGKKNERREDLEIKKKTRENRRTPNILKNRRRRGKRENNLREKRERERGDEQGRRMMGDKR